MCCGGGPIPPGGPVPWEFGGYPTGLCAAILLCCCWGAGPFVPSSAWLLLGGLGGICCPPAGFSWECPPGAPPVAGPPTAGDIEREDDEPVGEGVGLRPLGVTARGSFFCDPSSPGPSLTEVAEEGGGVGPGFWLVWNKKKILFMAISVRIGLQLKIEAILKVTKDESNKNLILKWNNARS